MAFVINTALTLAEVLRNNDPHGNFVPAIDVLSGNYPMLEELEWEQANGDDEHVFVRTASEPSGAFIGLNEGSALSGMSTTTARERLGMIEDRYAIDVNVLKRSASPGQKMMERDQMAIRGLTKTLNKVIFGLSGYGDGANPLQPTGLLPRYPSLATNSVVSAGAGSAGASASIWIVKHGEEGMRALYSKNAAKILEVNHLPGPITITDTAKGTNFFKEVEMAKINMEFGLKIGDPRCVRRMCNIVATTFTASGTASDAENVLIDLLYNIPGGLDNVSLYMSTALKAKLHIAMKNHITGNVTVQDIWGRKQLSILDCPIIGVDTLGFNEAIVS